MMLTDNQITVAYSALQTTVVDPADIPALQAALEQKNVSFLAYVWNDGILTFVRVQREAGWCALNMNN